MSDSSDPRNVNGSPSLSARRRPWYERIGPALITACVVIGPGSILTSSQVGARHGFAMSWVVVLSVLFMLAYMSIGARLGVVASESPGDLVARLAGRWLAVLIGGCVFFISSAFQFGNNLGVDSAVRVYLDTPWVGSLRTSLGFDPLNLTVIFFNAMTILFLFAFRNLYRAVERLMMTLVGIMLVSFAINLAFAQPSPWRMAAGLIPTNPATLGLPLLGLVGTTFVISAAYFQAYLVRQKGWGRAELDDGLLDTRVGAVMMAAITLMIMFTAAAVLRGRELAHVADVARQLEPLFGQWGQALFCLGLFSAAYSSFLVNSMIGGFILSDSLGLGGDPSDRWPKLLTTAVLLTGMTVALVVIGTGRSPVPAIVAAQAATVVASPLMAGVVLWLTNRHDVMGDDRNPWVLNLIAVVGLLMLMAMAFYTATQKVWPHVAQWFGGA